MRQKLKEVPACPKQREEFVARIYFGRSLDKNMDERDEKKLGARCSECGAQIEGGNAGCEALFNELGARDFSDTRYGATHELLVDAYCLQHPARYCGSAKSYAAHLTRMCCGIEHGGKRETYAAIPRWLSGPAKIERPATLPQRGSMTIPDLRRAQSPEEHAKLVREWAANVWQAYAPQHETARRWLSAALGRKP